MDTDGHRFLFPRITTAWPRGAALRGFPNFWFSRCFQNFRILAFQLFVILASAHFPAHNRKDEGIYYTPTGITGPMADSPGNSLAGKIVDEICAAVGSQKCDFAAADKLMAQLAERRHQPARQRANESFGKPFGMRR